MQRASLALCAVAALALTGPAAGQQPARWDTTAPVWNQTKSLLCNATSMHWCYIDGPCRRDSTFASWKIDFERNLIEYQTIDEKDEILFRHARVSPASGLRMSIFLGTGRVMEFGYDKAGEVTAWSIGIPEPLIHEIGTLAFEWACKAP